MTVPPPLPAAPAVLTYKALMRAVSAARFGGYSLDGDADSIDGAARYVWNLQIAATLWPTLHFVEVAFRNVLYDVGQRTTAERTFNYRDVPDCWLDATVPGRSGPESILERKEAADVAEAVVRLGKNARRRTAGHLVGRLGFGFWVRLCNAPYEQGNQQGPQLWPEARHRFPGCPKVGRNRGDIRAAFDDLRQFRNDLAHHQPLWDRDPIRWHQRAIELLGWMNPAVAAAVAYTSPLDAVVRAGHTAHRPLAASLVSVFA